MYKKLLSFVAISAILTLSACQSNDVQVGQFLGDLACLTADTNGMMSIEQIDEIGDANGFNDETEVAAAVSELNSAELDAQISIAMAHIEETCLDSFEAAEVDPKAFLDDFIASFEDYNSEETTEVTEEMTETEELDSTEELAEETEAVVEEAESNEEATE